MPSSPARVFALVLLVAVASASGTACTVAPAHRYERTGAAGAVMFLGGGVATWAGRQTIEANHEEAGVAITATGAALQLAGLLMAIWALDGLIQQPSTFDPMSGPGPIPR